MLHTQVINMVHNSLVSYGCYTGLGTPDAKIPGSTTPPYGPTYMEGMKVCLECGERVLLCLVVSNLGKQVVTLWQIFYMSGSVFIKTSICTTLLRLSVERRYNFILYGIIIITVITTLVTLISVWIQCTPLAASWGEVSGTCISTSVLITLTYVVSGLNIATDWSVALLPVAILWKLQMPVKMKIAITFVLGLGVFSSVATIVRLQYSKAYTATEDYLGKTRLLLDTLSTKSTGAGDDG